MKLISENLSITEMKKVKVKMNKPIYLRLSILQISKIIMYEFWYDYVKKKYGDMVKLCYTHTDSLVMNIKTKDFTRILHKMLKKGLTLQVMMLIDHYLKEKIRK